MNHPEQSSVDPPAERHGDDPAPAVRIALVTAPAGDALKLARRLVEEGTVACANLLPAVQSIYRWKGKVEEEKEALLLLKFPACDAESLQRRVEELHPYEVPELLFLDVDGGLPGYMEWVLASCSSVESQP